LIFVGYFLFITAALGTIGLRKVLRVFLVGSTCYLLVAWGAYLLVPSFGRFYEYTDATTTVTRMGGVAHPNAIAAEASVALLVCCAVIRDRRPGQRMGRWASVGWALLITLILATLYATMSRTAVLAAVAGLVMLMFDKLYGRRGALMLVGAVTLGASGLFVTMLTTTESVGDSAVAAVTKSDNVEELTSLTGRTEIWAEAISLIVQRPLTGYGLDSAASVMSEKSVGTHNLFLNVVFSTGIITGIFMLLLLGATLYLAFASDNPLFRGISTFVLISGLVDDTLFASFPCPITFLWISMLMSMSPPDRWRHSNTPSSALGG
ncbi:MAG: O-antigen ligase family protein, partial [Planctomycetales bacterium]|nr:O-antigen ligase family protein [Planctomycetales bacterium]